MKRSWLYALGCTESVSADSVAELSGDKRDNNFIYNITLINILKSIMTIRLMSNSNSIWVKDAIRTKVVETGSPNYRIQCDLVAVSKNIMSFRRKRVKILRQVVIAWSPEVTRGSSRWGANDRRRRTWYAARTLTTRTRTNWRASTGERHIGSIVYLFNCCYTFEFLNAYFVRMFYEPSFYRQKVDRFGCLRFVPHTT